MPNTVLDNRAVRRAFAEYDREETVNNFKVACAIGMVLMPAGIILDQYVYPDKLSLFIQLRLECSALIALFFGILLTPFARRHYRVLGVTLFMLPASFITWMIYATQGAASPYYAGLNLVLLVLAFVLHWTFRESLTAAALVIVLYLAASLAHGWIPARAVGPFINNL